jgi:hypothetical protein
LFWSRIFASCFKIRFLLIRLVIVLFLLYKY